VSALCPHNAAPYVTAQADLATARAKSKADLSPVEKEWRKRDAIAVLIEGVHKQQLKHVRNCLVNPPGVPYYVYDRFNQVLVSAHTHGDTWCNNNRRLSCAEKVHTRHKPRRVPLVPDAGHFAECQRSCSQ